MAEAGSPRMSDAILSISSNRHTGFIEPHCLMAEMMRPGMARDIRAPVSAKLGFIVHAAQRHLTEFLLQRPRDRPRDARLSYARRAHKAENRPMGILLERAHRNELQNALLHVLKAVMVAFQHVSSRGNVHGMLVVNAPRQVEHAFDVVLHHGALRRTGLRACQPLQLLLRALARFAGDRRSRQTGFILGNIVVVFAQFFLYHVQLLAQEIIAVVVIDPLVHAALNLLLDIADLKLASENIAHQLNAQLRVDAFQYGLAVVQIVQPHSRRSDRPARRGRVLRSQPAEAPCRCSPSSPRIGQTVAAPCASTRAPRW